MLFIFNPGKQIHINNYKVMTQIQHVSFCDAESRCPQCAGGCCCPSDQCRQTAPWLGSSSHSVGALTVQLKSRGWKLRFTGGSRQSDDPWSRVVMVTSRRGRRAPAERRRRTSGCMDRKTYQSGEFSWTQSFCWATYVVWKTASVFFCSVGSSNFSPPTPKHRPPVAPAMVQPNVTGTSRWSCAMQVKKREAQFRCPWQTTPVWRSALCS